MQQLILGTGTAIWWLTEPHSWVTQESTQAKQPTVVVLGLALKYSGSKWKSTLDVMLKVPQNIFFSSLTPATNVIKISSKLLYTIQPNKLECLFMPILSSLVYCLRVRPDPT